MSNTFNLVSRLLRKVTGEEDSTAPDNEQKTEELEEELEDGFVPVEESFTEAGEKEKWSDDEETNPLAPMEAPPNIEIPIVTRDAIYSNCVEVNMIPLFQAMPVLSKGLIQATLAIRISQLPHVTPEQLEVWDIPRDYPFIAIRVAFCEFSCFCFDRSPSLKRTVGGTPPHTHTHANRCDLVQRISKKKKNRP